ncbi:MAG: TetR/AcrR family transcriptional regulator [Oscillospiraceae bacterium]|nr:TetR/AcrR family transcriptional regulator [Oscillospiraceae bacterium]
MDGSVKIANLEKFMRLDESKRNRIINAAMKEFRYGYKKASTDAIVKIAGISKGLLYHYFVSKEQLYVFLVRHANELVNRNYFDLLNEGNADILEVFWQTALLKKDMSSQYPYLNDFTNGMYIHQADAPAVENAQLEEEQQAAYDELYSRCDLSLFRDDIDAEKAIDIIATAMDGLIDGEQDDDYEQFLDTLRGYLDIFRTCFYKKEAKDQ